MGGWGPSYALNTGTILRFSCIPTYLRSPYRTQPTLSSLPYSRLGRRGSRCTCIDWGVEFLSLASVQYTLTWTVDALQGSRNAFFMLPGTRFSWFLTRAFMVPETLQGSRNAFFMLPGTRFSWFPRSAFMVPETRFHGSRGALSWFPRRPFMVPETRFHGSRDDLSWFPKRPFMVPEMRSWFPKHYTQNMVTLVKFFNSNTEWIMDVVSRCPGKKARDEVLSRLRLLFGFRV